MYVIYSFGGSHDDHWQTSRFVVEDEEFAKVKVVELNAELEVIRQNNAILSEKCSNCPLAEYTVDAECFKYNNPESMEDELTEQKCKNVLGEYCSEFSYIDENSGIRCKFYSDRVFGFDDYEPCAYRYEKVELIE